MSEVTVTAAKPVIRREIDRVVFDAGNSIASVGGNALDLLHDVPGLRVSQSGVDIIGKEESRFISTTVRPNSPVRNSLIFFAPTVLLKLAR